MKTCVMCKRSLSDSFFLTEKKAYDRCSDCRKRRSDAVIRCRNKKNVAIAQYKKKKGCIVCGFDEPAALDFHHLDPNVKDATVASLCMNNASLEKVFQEIDKCVVVCANHHRMYHAGLVSF